MHHSQQTISPFKLLVLETLFLVVKHDYNYVSHLPTGPLYVMIPPSGGAELIQAMQQGQVPQRPLVPRIPTGVVPG